MKISGNTILITGGATGIGFALAEAFVHAGNEVIVCGRREDKLTEAKHKLPGISIRICDVSKEAERKSLYQWATTSFPSINVLVNNAGIQRRIDFKQGIADLLSGEAEIETNLTALIHFSAYFIPHLAKRKDAAIINVSSGLGFIPIAIMPVYCATKAAVHSFCLSLRHQLKATSIRVFEIIPPAVDTELDKGARAARGQTDRGIPPSEVAQATLNAIETEQYEVAVGRAEGLRLAAKTDPQQAFDRMNPR
ncbi:MAG: SDR family oxidoreductase [Coprothermobacterota bacterium]|nr:SDR family oxidoreductase [Coprothermobacterota bacterium]